MGRKGSLDNNVSFSDFTSSRDKIELQSSVLSTATQSTTDGGASKTKSFSEGTITRHQRDAEASTISSDGFPLAHQSSIRRVVSLEPTLPLNKEIVYQVAGKVEQDQLVDDIQSNFKLTSKAPHTEKHLMSDSSSSNSSHVIAPNHSEGKSQLELSVETVRSASLSKGECLKGIVNQLKSGDEQTTSETSQLSEQLCSEKMKLTESSVIPETWHKSTEAAHEELQLSKVSVTSDQGPKVCGFDLNEDLEFNEVGNAGSSIGESVSCYHEVNVSKPIVVMAKVGVPNGLPTVPLQFDGDLGWRSLGTSAFRPTFTCKKSVINTPSLAPKDFDLNVAPPSEPHAEGNKYYGRPNSQIPSFDLNDNLLADNKDTNSGLHHPGLSSQPKRSYAPIDSVNGSARQGNVSGIRPAYWVDLSSMPGFTHVQGQPFLVAAPNLFPSAEQKQTLLPLQPNVALAPGPPSGYYIGTSTGLSSSFYSPNILPHVGAAYPGSLNPGGYSTMRPSFFLNGGVGSSENASWVGSNTPAEERVKLSQTVALADKRKEPDGSWGSYQHNHRRMTAWK